MSPEFAGAIMAVGDFYREVHVDSLDIFREDGRARAESYCEELESQWLATFC